MQKKYNSEFHNIFFDVVKDINLIKNFKLIKGANFTKLFFCFARCELPMIAIPFW